MFTYIWPIVLVVVSNVIYQISAKMMPKDLNPFASLTITYLIGAVASGLLFFLTSKGGNLIKEYSKANWVPFVLGLVIVGLEAGWIYAYKSGWEVSKGFIVQSSFLAVILLVAGFLLFKEPITWNKIVGVIICLIGLAVINL